MTDIGLIVRLANPVPDESQQLTDDELSAVLLLTQQRSGEMDAKELTRPIEPDKKPKRSGLLVAMGAFAAVIILIAGLAFVLNSPSDDAPPATTPTTTLASLEDTPTTTLAPAVEDAPTTTVVDKSLSPADQAFVDQFIETFNAGDESAITELISPNPNMTSYLQTGGGREAWVREVKWRWALGEQWAIGDCEFSFGSISCPLTVSGGWFEHLGPMDGSIQFAIGDDGVTTMVVRENTAVLIPESLLFWSFVEAQFPDDLDVVRSPGGDPAAPKTTDESIAAWVRLIPLYRATLGG